GAYWRGDAKGPMCSDIWYSMEEIRMN
ncbi:hypothetical protein WwAna0595, partial [Wolbachia endosymbiont of Drosophila ananassae]